MKDWKSAYSSETVCFCKDVTKEEIVEALKSGCNSLKEIQESTNACTGNECEKLNPEGRCCSIDIQELIRMYGTGGSGEGSCCSCCRG